MTEATLKVRVRVSPALNQPGMFAGVMYRKWGGMPVHDVAVSAPVAEGDIELVVPVPKAHVLTTLPPALGGPWPFGLAYLIVFRPSEGDPDDREIFAVASEHRVLWTESQFPAAAFEKLAGAPDVTPDEVQKMGAELAAMPIGLSLVKSTRMQRSLVGFVVAADEVIELSQERSGPWPPNAF